VCQSHFPCSDKYLKKQLKGRKIYFGSYFHKFQSIMMVREEGVVEQNILYHENQRERDRETERQRDED
jgi:hypothetical protein